MAKTTLQTIKNWKKKSCAGKKGAYSKMRAACKRYVAQAGKSAPVGKKSKAMATARKKANNIIKIKCKR